MTSKIIKYILIIPCLLGLSMTLFAPIFAILFFAVSPFSVFSGEKLRPGQETIAESYICPMGIEWHKGSEKYLPSLGFSHANHTNHSDQMDHSDHNMMDHSNHNMMDHSDHNMMDHSNHNMMDHSNHQNHDAPTEESPEPCMIEKFMALVHHDLSVDFSLLHFAYVLTFALLYVASFKVYILYVSRQYYDLIPRRQAPPSFPF